MRKEANNNHRCQAGPRGSHRRSEQAFTMVEIALSLAVVAFALVAIIGVLPLGMTVQKDNREDTLMNQEGRYWLEAIKSGASGLHDLTNYVEEIRITSNPSNRPPALVIVNNTEPYLTGSEIISLLSIAKHEFIAGRLVTNRITARVRAITGPATDQSPFTNTVQSTFRYELQSELVPVRPLPDGFVARLMQDDTNNLPTLLFNEAMATNLWDVRLILRWPVVERGNGWFVGNSRKTFRARVSGELLVATNTNPQKINNDDRALRRFAPNQFNVAGLQ